MSALASCFRLSRRDLSGPRNWARRMSVIVGSAPGFLGARVLSVQLQIPHEEHRKETEGEVAQGVDAAEEIGQTDDDVHFDAVSRLRSVPEI